MSVKEKFCREQVEGIEEEEKQLEVRKKDHPSCFGAMGVCI